MTKEQKKIIVVDDNNTNLTACKKILRPFYEVYTVPSAEKMFDLLEHVMPDMILLDVDMPEMNGYEAAGRLKKNDAFRGIPIIFLTGRIDAKSEMFGLNMGAMDYIHKPFVSELLLRRIEIHLALTDYRKILEERNKSIEELLELKTKEVLQREAAEAEAKKASRAKDEFLSRMSQEIRSPLDAIIGMLSIAANSDDPENVSNCVKKAGDESKRLLALINDMLDMSKIETVKNAGDFGKRTGDSRYNFAGHTILVAENNEINREVLAVVLEKTGASIDFAENGKIAVSMFEKNSGKYSLILMNVQMPEMNGYDATLAIRSLESGKARDIPIIALSANAFREEIEKCLSAGMNGHVGKPIEPENLYMTMEKYIAAN